MQMKKFLLSTFCMLMVGFSFAQQTHWVPVSNFENTMDGIGIVIIDGVEQFRGDLELGIFCGDECRGALFAEDETDHWFYYFTMGGVSGESFTFRLYDHDLDEELYVTCTNAAVPFEANAFLGDFDAPYEIVFTAGASTVTNITDGDWSDPNIWGGTVPGPEASVVVDDFVTIGENGAVTVTVTDLDIPSGSTLIVEAGSVLVVTGDLITGSTDGLILADGAQVINESSNVLATYQKDIAGYLAKDSDGWYTISSPMDDMTISGSDFVVPEYDLYRFNETTIGGEWENYKDATNIDFTTFENGRGYIYANSANITPNFVGILNNADMSVAVTYTDRTDGLSGINLIGNPFPHVIYKGAGGAIDDADLASGFYTLTDQGAWHVCTYETAIQPGQGILVKTAVAGTVDIVKTTNPATAESSAKSAAGRMKLNIAGNNNEDCAYVYFSQGLGLTKMPNFDVTAPSLFIHNDEGDYAIAHTGIDSEALELMFKNSQSGDFTLSVGTEGLRFSYLHLIDRVAGTDTDLLQTPEYRFTATGLEDNARFQLVFRVMTGVNETVEEAPFAFINNGQLIVNAEGTLQILDMTGRVVSTHNTTDHIATNGMANGVYVLRLMNENNVRTQKIVIK